MISFSQVRSNSSYLATKLIIPWHLLIPLPSNTILLMLSPYTKTYQQPCSPWEVPFLNSPFPHKFCPSSNVSYSSPTRGHNYSNPNGAHLKSISLRETSRANFIMGNMDMLILLSGSRNVNLIMGNGYANFIMGDLDVPIPLWGTDMPISLWGTCICQFHYGRLDTSSSRRAVRPSFGLV